MRWLALGRPSCRAQPAEGVHRAALGEPLRFGDEFVQVFNTPGHTADCLSFVWRDRVFCGGLLAVDACPTSRNPLIPPPCGTA